MRSTMSTLTLLLVLASLPNAFAQDGGTTPATAQTFLAAPHSIFLDAGQTNEVSFGVAAEVTCAANATAPPPLEVAITAGAVGPSDGQGPAWRFLTTSWMFNWTATPAGNTTNHTIDERFTALVEAEGHRDRGVTGDMALEILPVEADDACSGAGLRVPRYDAHAHVQTGARAAGGNAGEGDGGQDEEDTPGLPGALVGVALAVALRMQGRRRRA